jgi:iron complex transport system ATP-binding protein
LPTTVTTREAVIAAHALHVRLGKSLVLRGVSASARPGEVTGIIGPNGSGKTTLLRALAALAGVESGAVSLGGEPLASMSAGQRARRIAYMPQIAGAHPFTALDLVLMGRYPRLGRFQLEGKEDHDAALAAMRRTGTEEFAGRRMDTLSGGERQRVALARTLTQEADALLLDEPTASLDLKRQLLTMETVTVEARKRGAAVVVVMHDLSLAGRYCDQLHLLSEGRVVASGEPWKVLTRQNLESAFGIEALIEPNPVNGRPSVMPLGLPGARDGAAGGARRRVHLICGAGSGRELMHRLQTAGLTVSACVLGEGDNDREAALRLGIEHIAAPPFSAVTPEQDAAHRDLVRSADTVLVCDMAIGPGNFANLMAAGEAKNLLLLERPSPDEWDYVGGQAHGVFQQLSAKGRIISRDEALAALKSVT